VNGLDGALAEVGRRLRRLVLSAAPSATESIKWAQPVYEDSGPFCYFKASRSHITLGFWRGTELDDPQGRLEGDGDRMKHLKVRSAGEIEDDVIAGWVRQAVELNRQRGNPTRQASARGQATTAGAVAVESRDGDEAAKSVDREPAALGSESIPPIAEVGPEDPFGRPWKDR
jgi:hypothetical protein